MNHYEVWSVNLFYRDMDFSKFNIHIIHNSALQIMK